MINSKIIILFVFTSALMKAQFGAFGEIKVKATNYPLFTTVADNENLGQYTGSLRTESRTNYDEGLLRLDILYSRFFATGLSTYVSVGLGYSNLNSKFEFLSNTSNRNEETIDAEVQQQHYINLPIRFHILFNNVRRQSYKSDEIKTAAMLSNERGGFGINFGTSFYYAVAGAQTKIYNNDSEQFTEQLTALTNGVADNFSTLFIVPEFSLEFSFSSTVMLELTGGYWFQPLYNNNIVDNPTGTVFLKEYQLQENFSEKYYSLSASISFRF